MCVKPFSRARLTEPRQRPRMTPWPRMSGCTQEKYMQRMVEPRSMAPGRASTKRACSSAKAARVGHQSLERRVLR